MANILLTSYFHHSRPSCSPRNEMSVVHDNRSLSWENLIYITDFLRASCQRRVYLSGGESTVHPHYIDFILYLLHRGFDVTVFTDGILSPSRLEEFWSHLAEVPIERLDLVCTLNEPVQTSAEPQEMARLHNFLAAMGSWTQASFNIHCIDFTLDFLFDYITRFGMKRNLRLGIAHPISGSQERRIHARDMGRVVERLYAYRHLFDTYGICPDLSCDFPLWASSDAELGWLHRSRGYPSCGCKPTLGILPDMTVYHYCPLTNYQRKSLFEFDSMEQIERYFALLRDDIKARNANIYEECDDCRCQEDGECDGRWLCQIAGISPMRTH